MMHARVPGCTSRFIVGMPRAGSTWLMRTLNQHPEIACFGETSFWGRGYVQPARDGKYHREQLQKAATALKNASYETVIGQNEPGYLRKVTDVTLGHVIDTTLEAVEIPVDPGETFVSLCGAVAALEGKKYWVEKTPHHVIWTDRILRWLPNSRFVVTLRDPGEFMLSYKHTRGMSDQDARVLEAMYHPLACAYVYRTYARVAARLAERMPGRALLVHLEQIRDDPAAAVNRVLDFFQFEPFPQDESFLPLAYSSFSDEPRPELSPSERYWAAVICAPAARDLGYTIDWPGFMGSEFYKPILSFPVWVYRLFRLMSVRVEGSTVRYLWRWLFPRRAG